MSLNRQSYKLPAELSGAVQASIDDWKKNNKVSRLWEHDASLWTNDDEAKWLGWLEIVNECYKATRELIEKDRECFEHIAHTCNFDLLNAHAVLFRQDTQRRTQIEPHRQVDLMKGGLL